MFINDRFYLMTAGLAIALTMGGCAAPADEPDPAAAPASEASQERTGQASSATVVAVPTVGFGACAAPLAFGAPLVVGAPLIAPIAAVPAVGFAPVGIGFGAFGCAPAIGFREDAPEADNAAPE